MNLQERRDLVMDNMSGNMGCKELLIKNFCHYLIENSSNSYIHVDDIPYFCAEYIDILKIKIFKKGE